MNKKLMVFVFAIALIGVVTAAWLFSISGGFTMIVESLPGYSSINLDVPTLQVNTTNSMDSDTQVVSFILNKDINLSVDIMETFQDLSGGECIGGENDCEIVYEVYNITEYVEIQNGTSVFFWASPYSRNLTATMTCVAYSCPQSRTSEINLVEIK